ncbi:hypothetical protein [Humibacter sp.]|uniref:hypothetical protein n=1 Tax=Humibacter sp. TaxID=1940291 RepID=UPI003F7D9A30
MSAPRYSDAVLEALARWDRTRRLCNDGRLSWESVAEAEQGLASALDDFYAHASPLIGDPTRDAFRESAMRAAEDEALEAHRQAMPHRFGGVL